MHASLDGNLTVALKIGVAQGGRNSPGDFILYINGLLEQILEERLVDRQEFIGGYADDLKFYARGFRQP
jgi:hypothetical protein